MDTERSASSSTGGDVKNPEQKPEIDLKIAEKVVKESPTELKEESKNEFKDLAKIVEIIEFKNGDNILTIRLSQTAHRMYRTQVFLNDEVEIRPVSYTGSSMAFSFWNLLKGAMKK